MPIRSPRSATNSPRSTHALIAKTELIEVGSSSIIRREASRSSAWKIELIIRACPMNITTFTTIRPRRASTRRASKLPMCAPMMMAPRPSSLSLANWLSSWNAIAKSPSLPSQKPTRSRMLSPYSR